MNCWISTSFRAGTHGERIRIGTAIAPKTNRGLMIASGLQMVLRAYVRLDGFGGPLRQLPVERRKMCAVC